jgi:hypothetical protein
VPLYEMLFRRHGEEDRVLLTNVDHTGEPLLMFDQWWEIVGRERCDGDVTARYVARPCSPKDS